MLQVAESGAVKKLNVEGGVAAKARAVYAGLFVPATPALDSNGSSSPPSPGSPKANGSSDAAANGNGSKLTPAVVAAVPLLKQLASDPAGQLAQLVAMEWLLAVSRLWLAFLAGLAFLAAAVVMECSRVMQAWWCSCGAH
jgi:hypothetical protein